MKSSSIDSKLLSCMQAMKENDLTERVLKPLFESFGYDNVEFYGGCYELGKDLICWKKDDWNDIDVTVVQTKMYKPTAKAGGSRTFGEIVTQIGQAAHTQIEHKNGQKYFPSAVHFVTPYAIDTRALSSNFATIQTIKDVKIKIIDGKILVQRIKEKVQHIIAELIGSSHLLNNTVLKSLNNYDLRNALNTDSLKDISDVYCDLDFAIGNITTKSLLSLNPSPANIPIELSPTEWFKLKQVCEKSLLNLNVNVLVDKPETTELIYDQTIAHNELIDAKINKLLEKILLLGIKNSFENIADLAASDENEEIQEAGCSIKTVLADYESNIKKGKEDYTFLLDTIDHEIKQLSKHSDGPGKINSYIKSYLKARAKEIDYEEKISTLEEKKKSALYSAVINGNEICKTIKSKQQELILNINGLKSNSKNKSKNKINKFISVCHNILTQTESLLRYELIASAAGVSKHYKFDNIEMLDRINFSIHEVFDSGHDFVVFGEAGAGKTTTLQMYAKNKINTLGKAQAIYIPLARSFQKLDITGATELDYCNYLVNAIVNYLKAQGVSGMDDLTIKDIANTNSTIFIFDGIDEVIDRVPWIIKAIASFKSKYPKVQLITSSRLSGNYINNIPFMGLSLLPFTNEQRILFLKSWFKCDSEKVDLLINHLEINPELDAIVRNPLLATILCYLAEYNKPLPSTEIRLYEDRMMLLLGRYDERKEVSRIKSHTKDLQLVSRKVAFFLHRKETRYAHKSVIIQSLFDAYNSSISREEIELAIEELINPCNVMVPMTDDGQIGFGHLRFQEYLVACNIKENFNIEVSGFITKPFWRGALVLLSKMAESIEPLIANIVQEQYFSKYAENLEAMIKARPDSEHEFLLNVIRNNRSREYYYR